MVDETGCGICGGMVDDTRPGKTPTGETPPTEITETPSRAEGIITGGLIGAVIGCIIGAILG